MTRPRERTIRCCGPACGGSWLGRVLDSLREPRGFDPVTGRMHGPPGAPSLVGDWDGSSTPLEDIRWMSDELARLTARAPQPMVVDSGDVVRSLLLARRAHLSTPPVLVFTDGPRPLAEATEVWPWSGVPPTSGAVAKELSAVTVESMRAAIDALGPPLPRYELRVGDAARAMAWLKGGGLQQERPAAPWLATLGTIPVLEEPELGPGRVHLMRDGVPVASFDVPDHAPRVRTESALSGVTITLPDWSPELAAEMQDCASRLAATMERTERDDNP